MDEPIEIKFEVIDDDILRSSQVPSGEGKRKSENIKVITKHFKRTVVSYDFFKDGKLVFTTPTTKVTAEIGSPGVINTPEFPCTEEEFFTAQNLVIKQEDATEDETDGASAASSILETVDVGESQLEVSQSNLDRRKLFLEKAAGPNDFEEDPREIFRIGDAAFHRGERVFALWDLNGKWYTARVGGVRQSTNTFRVEWCENREVSYVEPADIVSHQAMLQPGIHVAVLMACRVFYVDMILIEFRRSGRHLMLPSKIKDKMELVKTEFEWMVIQPAEVERLREIARTAPPRSPSPELAGPSTVLPRSLPDQTDFSTKTRNLLEKIEELRNNLKAELTGRKTPGKSRDVTGLPPAEDIFTAYLHEDFSVEYQMADQVFHQGQQVFAAWDKKSRWFFGRVTGVRKLKLGVRWHGRTEVNYVDPQRMVAARTIFDSCLRIQFLSRNGRFFKPVHSRTSVAECYCSSVLMIDSEDMRSWMEARAAAAAVSPLAENGVSVKAEPDRYLLGSSSGKAKAPICPKRLPLMNLPEPEEFLRCHFTEETAVQCRIVQQVYYRGEKIFASWKHGSRWFLARVADVQNGKFAVLWNNSSHINFVDPANVVRASEIAQRGTIVYVMPVNKSFYKKFIFKDKFLDQNFEQAMIEPEEVERWRQAHPQSSLPPLSSTATPKPIELPPNIPIPPVLSPVPLTGSSSSELPSIDLFKRQTGRNSRETSQPSTSRGFPTTGTSPSLDSGIGDDDSPDSTGGQFFRPICPLVDLDFGLPGSGGTVSGGRGPCMGDVLALPNVVAAIARHLPMRSLNAFCQVNQLLSHLGRLEKQKPRRQHFYVVMQLNAQLALHNCTLSRVHLFCDVLSNVYCQPQLILAFSSPSSMNAPLQRAIRDLLPAVVTDTSNILHVVTDGVLCPLAVPNEIGYLGYMGYHVAADDLALLFIPQIDGVTIYRKFRSWTLDDLRERFPNAVWWDGPDGRPEIDFILPVIRNLVPLNPKLIIILSKYPAKHRHIANSSCPVIIFPAPLAHCPLDALIFRGNLVAYQIHLDGADQAGHAEKIRQLRNQFTLEQVAGSRMLLLYLRNSPIEPVVLDVMCLRSEFPSVPIFGGVYDGVIGNCFTGDRVGPEHGRFFGGPQSILICGVVLGRG